MRGAPPPLRFLVLTVAGWVAIRTAMLVPNWWSAPLGAAPAEPLPVVRPVQPPEAIGAPIAAAAMQAPRPRPTKSREWPPLSPLPPSLPAGVDGWTLASAPPFELPAPIPERLPPRQRGVPIPALPHPLPHSRPRASSWSGSAWLLARRGSGDASLAPGGTLGGSQAGVRIGYRLAPALAVSGRLYAPLDRWNAAEAALGLEWQPAHALPVRLLVERRQRLGAAGRSAFAATLHGGLSEQRLPGGLELDAYGQAGIVGFASRDLFAEGAVRVSLPVGPVDVGGSAWAAAQPGASRVDIGPHVALKLPLEGRNLRLIADWRFRVAGDARPGSGPALVLSTDF